MDGTWAYRFGLLGVLFFVVSTILAGLQFSGYSHIAQLISESYAIGSPYGLPIRFFGFLPSGLFLAAFAFFAARATARTNLAKAGFWGIGLFYGIATVIVSLFPCDEGCNKELIDPSLSQIIHNLTGLLTYTIVPISLLLLGLSARQWMQGKHVSISGIACGLMSMLFVGILSADLASPYIGLYQRIIEGSILFWILRCALYLKTMPATK